MKSLKSILLVMGLIMLGSWNDAQTNPRIINGIVTDASTGNSLAGVTITVKGSIQTTKTALNGSYKILVPTESAILIFSFTGYASQEIQVGKRSKIDVSLESDHLMLEESVIIGYGKERKKSFTGSVMNVSGISVEHDGFYHPTPRHNTEEYATIHENTFQDATKNPLSTFSIDVDNASYSNMRRFINMGQTPPKDVVRIEEMINYFSYNYPQPKGEHPFSVNTEISDCPWNADHKLIHVGLQGKSIPTENLPPSNLVFLIDVSGSMDVPNKLPLVKTAFKLLVNELRPQDRVAIVVYAGAAGLVLPSTPGSDKGEILAAIDNLEAGGSTAGGAGLQLAYKTAEEYFIKKGNNRVILASDGDFNVGVSSNAAMERLIEEKRESGVFLTVLGFGMGNYKDSKMETLANKGNGNYAYIDNALEAKKVFVNEFGGTLFTIAKDVKFQLEFNPAKVKAYRLIGYENRALRDEDFNNDKKDAGEMGSGHTVTALYEVILAGTKASPFFPQVDDLKYQQEKKVSPLAHNSNEILTIKLRYKKPDGNKSILIHQPLTDAQTPLQKTSDNFRFSAAVAQFGMLLRESEFVGSSTFAQVVKMAEEAKGADKEGYRAEFINLVRSMELLALK